MFISPQNHILPRVFSLTKSCSNNVTEYNALLISLQLAHEMGVRYFEVYGDSKLIVNKVKGEYEVRHEDLVPYYHAVIKIANLFDRFYIGHVSQSQNTRANALAALATTLALSDDTKYHLTVVTRHLVCSKYMLRTKGAYNISMNFEPKDRQFSLIDYALHGLLPDDPKEAASIRRRPLYFFTMTQH